MHNISQVKLRATPIPLPPLAEQGRIVEEVGRRFSGAEALEEAVASGLVRAEQMRRAILGRAFKEDIGDYGPRSEADGDWRLGSGN